MKLPEHGEVWLKLPHAGYCRCGWSLGAGVAVIDKTVKYDWGDEHHIECGCLIKLADDIYDYEKRGLNLIHGDPRYARGSILYNEK